MMDNSKIIRYNPELKQFSRKLRQSGNLSEALLWKFLRARQVHGMQFTRQKPIGNYIVDFYCPKLKLAIEIDGISHDWKYEYDLKRTSDLEKLGITVLRFKDSEVRKRIKDVVFIIEDWVVNHKQPPNPL
jgi:very-short-patch-repair endonuclease